MLLSNEFATVNVELDESARGPRLKVQDMSSGVAIYLDPLELACLAWARHEDLTHFSAPDFRERAAQRLLGNDERPESVLELDAVPDGSPAPGLAIRFADAQGGTRAPR